MSIALGNLPHATLHFLVRAKSYPLMEAELADRGSEDHAAAARDRVDAPYRDLGFAEGLRFRYAYGFS